MAQSAGGTGESAAQPLSVSPKFFVRLLRRSSLFSPAVQVGLVATSLLLVGAVDYATGPGISLILGYGMVIVGAALVLPRGPVLITACAAVACSTVVGLVHPDATLETVTVVVNGALRLIFFLGLAEGASLLRRTVLELSELADVDPLTGLHNRRAFAEIADHERQRAIRTGRPLCVATFDLNGLKRINDELGHHQGDELIRQFAADLAANFRGSDCVARVGGDEFATVLPETDVTEVRTVIDRLADAVGPRAFSCGIAWSPDPHTAIDELVGAADEAMYRAKRGGFTVAVETLRPPVEQG